MVFSDYPACGSAGYKQINLLLVVIGLALDDGAGAVKLFGEDETHHLMGERHLRQ